MASTAQETMTNNRDEESKKESLYVNDDDDDEDYDNDDSMKDTSTIGSGHTSAPTSSTTNNDDTAEDGRDAIRQKSAKETARIHHWRIIVMLALLVTAVSVTVSTYLLLLKQEDENFRSAVRFIWIYLVCFHCPIVVLKKP